MEIQKYFDKNFHRLDEKAINALDKHDNGSINNVINNLEEKCYGVHLLDDKDFFDYYIFYIDGKNDLSGVGLYLSLNLDTNTRTNYTIEFCKFVNYYYPHIDIVDTFNAFQIQTRTIFEKIGFFTIGNEIDEIKGISYTFLVKGKLGIIKFPTLDKITLFRWLFNENKEVVNIDTSKTKKVYLLLDTLNNLIKIGQSFYPNLREKTLQGINPNWFLITTWIAPISEEKYLHNRFESKHKRGEWFDLSFSDLKEIKEYMNKYK